MSTIAPLEQRIRLCARLFRLGCDVEGGLALVELFDEFLKRLGEYPPSVAQQCPVVLNALLQAQQRQDWLGLADTLEVELLQLLAQEQA